MIFLFLELQMPLYGETVTSLTRKPTAKLAVRQKEQWHRLILLPLGLLEDYQGKTNLSITYSGKYDLK